MKANIKKHVCEMFLILRQTLFRALKLCAQNRYSAVKIDLK